MKRQLFLHHYFPALYFGIIAFSQLFDYLTVRIPTAVTGRKSSAINGAATVVFLAISGAVFALFAPLAYGSPWTKAECQRVKLFKTWDFDCNTFYDNYDSYAEQLASASSAAISSLSAAATSAPSSAQAVDANIAPPVIPPPVIPAAKDDKQAPLGKAPAQAVPEADISGAPVPQEPRILSKEEKVEYRDQDGNLLDEEQIKALEGKVKFETKYETKTRIVDGEGNEVPEPAGGWPEEILDLGVAPPHPDVEGLNKETVQAEEAQPVQDAAASRDGEKEAEQAKAKPASDNNEATIQDEL
jgi:dolichyl-phosphate-mannose-protein mannosyltransferase